MLLTVHRRVETWKTLPKYWPIPISSLTNSLLGILSMWLNSTHFALSFTRLTKKEYCFYHRAFYFAAWHSFLSLVLLAVKLLLDADMTNLVKSTFRPFLGTQKGSCGTYKGTYLFMDYNEIQCDNSWVVRLYLFENFQICKFVQF